MVSLDTDKKDPNGPLCVAGTCIASCAGTIRHCLITGTCGISCWEGTCYGSCQAATCFGSIHPTTIYTTDTTYRTDTTTYQQLIPTLNDAELHQIKESFQKLVAQIDTQTQPKAEDLDLLEGKLNEAIAEVRAQKANLKKK